MKRIAFYAPIKPPDHPIASGDRLIARNLITALQLAGYSVDLGSKFIAYSKKEDASILRDRKTGALTEAEHIIQTLQSDPPAAWMTYHPYCKAPDWIGPRVCQELCIPYITVEAARTGQGFEDGGDRWALWREEAQAGLREANLHIAFKKSDIDYLETLMGSKASIRALSPFIDTTQTAVAETVSLPGSWRPDAPTIVVVGMMRPGKKRENYRLILKALRPLQSLHWNLILVGDGPERQSIKDDFGAFEPARILFTGALAHEKVLGLMAQSDLFLWPGGKEPIGMVYLEAQMMGLPVAAFDSMGVSLSVRHGQTGLLAAENNLNEFTRNIATLLSHPKLRDDFSQSAKENVMKNHSLDAAAQTLSEHLVPLIGS